MTQVLLVGAAAFRLHAVSGGTHRGTRDICLGVTVKQTNAVGAQRGKAAKAWRLTRLTTECIRGRAVLSREVGQSRVRRVTLRRVHFTEEHVLVV